jgi:alanine dehydrogenase
MVQAANIAVLNHPFWKAEFARLEPRLGRSKAIVAIARKLLVAVWHVLKNEVADCHADEINVANSFMALAIRIGAKNIPEKKTAKAYTRQHMDRLGIGSKVKTISRGSRLIKLPPSQLKE